ncbi:MAG: ribosome-associated translation inhibitor RaiA [Alphaproteobacteria bacterium]
MQVPLQITFRGLDPSDAIRAKIEERVERLERFHGRITGCRVVVEASDKHRHKGHLYNVRVDVTVPGSEVATNRAPAKAQDHQDVYVAIRDAFDATERRLEDHLRRVRGDTKTHEAQPHGRVIKLFPEREYGFIESSDGREVYFHRNAVTDDAYDRLSVGTTVRFTEIAGEEGAVASTVHIVGKHQRRD